MKEVGMSDLRKRSITGLVIGMVILGSIFAGEISYSVFICVIGFFINLEIYQIVVSKKNQVNAVIYSLLTTMPLIVRFLEHFEWLNFSMYHIIVGVPLLIIAGFTLFIHKPVLFGGKLLVALCLSLGYITLALANSIYVGWGQGAFSIVLCLSIFLFIWANDVFAYLIGRKIGKTVLAKTISPKKTWEGTIGGVVCTTLVGVVLCFTAAIGTIWFWIGLSLVCAIGAIIGDLLESSVKRYVGVKDSGHLLPGHGGFFDRFDSFICVLPIAAFYIFLFL